MKPNQQRLSATVLLASLILTGCSGMESLISPQVRYGQLYSLHDALHNAAKQCEATPLQRADYWAMTAAANLQRHRSFLNEEALLSKTDELLEQLYALQWQENAGGDGCHRYQRAGQTTGELLALLNTPAPLRISRR